MSESAAARRKRARAEAEGQTIIEEVVEETPGAASEEAVDPMAAMLDAVAEPAPSEPVVDEQHVAENLIAAAPALFQVTPEVAEGALHHAGVSPNDQTTVPEVRRAIEDFLKIPV